MNNLTLTQITKVCDGELFSHQGFLDHEVKGVVIDSRQVEEGYLFIATVGERVDSHNFIDDVFSKGASAVLCEKTPSNPKGPYILVKNSFIALKEIAKFYRMQLDIKVVGITGSVGKTSTKEIIASTLAEKYSVLKTEGNYNNEIGLPLTILKIRDYHEVAVLEMGISEFGEMERLSEIAKPDICVITNIGQCHLETLGSREGILKAKTEVFLHMKEDAFVCLNGDDDMLSSISTVGSREPIFYGFGANNTVTVTKLVNNGLLGSHCDIHLNGNILSTTVPLPGEHMVSNAMAAATVGALLSMKDDEIIRGIANVKSVGGRSNIIKTKQFTLIDDCYNASPVSMKSAIDLLNTVSSNKVAILGDMFELGANEKELHKEVGTYPNTGLVNTLLCVGPLSYHLYQGAKETGFTGNLLYFESKEALITELPSILKEGDSILIKASNGMGFRQVVDYLKEF